MMNSDFNCPDVSSESLKESENFVLKKADTLRKSKKSRSCYSIDKKTNENRPQL